MIRLCILDVEGDFEGVYGGIIASMAYASL